MATFKVNERLVNHHDRPPGGSAMPAVTEDAHVDEKSPTATGTRKVKGRGEKQINKLTGPFRFKLNKQLEKELPVLEAEGMTVERAAEYMSTVMGVEVTKGHMETARKDTGLKWKSKMSGRERARGEGRTSRVYRVLAYTLAKLHEKMGEPIPAILLTIYNKRILPSDDEITEMIDRTM